MPNSLHTKQSSCNKQAYTMNNKYLAKLSRQCNTFRLNRSIRHAMHIFVNYSPNIIPKPKLYKPNLSQVMHPGNNFLKTVTLQVESVYSLKEYRVRHGVTKSPWRLFFSRDPSLLHARIYKWHKPFQFSFSKISHNVIVDQNTVPWCPRRVQHFYPIWMIGCVNIVVL